MISLKEIDLIGINLNSFESFTYSKALLSEGEAMSDSDFLNKLQSKHIDVLKVLNSKNTPLYNTQIHEETGLLMKNITNIMDFLEKYRLTAYTRDIDKGSKVHNMITRTGKHVLEYLEEINKEVSNAPDYGSEKAEDYIKYLIKDANSELIEVEVSFIPKRKNMMRTKMKCIGKDFYNCTHSTCEAIIEELAKENISRYSLKPPEYDGEKCVFKVIF